MATKLETTTRLYDWSTAAAVTVNGTSAQSSAIAIPTELLLCATQAMHIKVGTNPTAVAGAAGNIFLAAGEKFHLQWAAGDKVAAIQDSVAGVLYILPVK